MSSIGVQHNTKHHDSIIAPLPPPPTWTMPAFPSRPTYPLPPNVYSPSNLGPPSTPYNKIADGASYISMPGYNGADSVVSSVKQNRTCNCLVSHTYKQFKKLWEGADKNGDNRGGKNMAMKHVVGGGGLIADRLVAKKFETEHSTNSETGTLFRFKHQIPKLLQPQTPQDTTHPHLKAPPTHISKHHNISATHTSESGDSTSSQSKGDKSGKKTGADSGLGSGERSLPPLPHHTSLDHQISDNNNNNKTSINSPSKNSLGHLSNASNNAQHHKLPTSNNKQCKFATIFVA